ncbi:LacI family DNA-binding transcriptional regulator [Thalassospira lucentensis]|uniref:LacI family DNA-binding transcriptional regulator n=1 Tax=Thalassospira lucentensis TaxID=168935 RepID=UPI003D2B5291
MPKTTGPIIKDIAELCGVSPATVDRVLNKRPGVRERTAKRVLQAAGELGYLPETDMVETFRPKPMQVVFLLPSGTNPYLRLLGDRIKTAAEATTGQNIRARCFFIDGFNPQLLSEALRQHGQKADGIAFMAIDHPLVRETVSELQGAGKHMITVVSDISGVPHAAYVGLDNRAVGRTAGYMLGRFMGPNRADNPHRGRVALIAASRTYRAHEEREMGFLSLMEEAFPGMSLVAAREGHDDRSENYHHTMSLLEEYPDLVGIYNVGGSSDGVARALRESGRGRDIIFIGHGLTPDTRRFLLEDIMDVVITQSPGAIVQNALRIFDNLRNGSDPNADVAKLTMEVVVKENLP